MARGDSHELAGHMRPNVRVAHVMEETEVEYQIEGAVLEGEPTFEVDACDREGRPRMRLGGQELAQTPCVAISTYQLLARRFSELWGEATEPAGKIEDAFARPGLLEK